MDKLFDVAIVGGSNAGLSASLILGRALRETIIFDTGNPRNKYALNAHDFLTRDGEKPSTILKIARQQLKPYKSVKMKNKRIVGIEKKEDYFILIDDHDVTYKSRRVILATGVTDVIPVIPGLKKAWGKNAIHCPYCHAWEFKNQTTGIVCGGEAILSKAISISNWSKDLIFFTNGRCTLNKETREKAGKKFPIYQDEIEKVKVLSNGLEVFLCSGEKIQVNALYVPTNYQYNNQLALHLGCKLQKEGAVQVDENCETTIKGVYAVGDLISQKLHHIVLAAANGVVAGEDCNIQLNKEDFEKLLDYK